MSRLIVAALAAGALAGGLALQMTPSPADPGPTDRPDHHSEEFRAVGDGTLPEDRPSLREPGAPLSSAERGYAIHRVLASLPDSARDVRGAPGAEILAADLPPDSTRADLRRVQVSAYDYATDRLHQAIVDLPTGLVDQTAVVQGLQLPPSAAETQVALDLALAARPPPAFVRQFQDVTGAPLLAGDQVHVVAGAWVPDDAGPAGHHAEDTACGPHRCVQLLMALPSGQYLNTTDFVVDLSARAVVPIQPGDHHEH